MKKVKFLFLLGLMSVMAFSFSACSDDDDEIGSADDLVGTWESVYYSYQDKENGVIVDEDEGPDTDLRIVFNANGTCTTAEYYSNQWHYYDGDATWSYANGKITIVTEDGIETATVKELTSSKLVVETVESYMDNGISCEDYSYTEYRKISE